MHSSCCWHVDNSRSARRCLSTDLSRLFPPLNRPPFGCRAMTLEVRRTAPTTLLMVPTRTLRRSFDRCWVLPVWTTRCMRVIFSRSTTLCSLISTVDPVSTCSTCSLTLSTTPRVSLCWRELPRWRWVFCLCSFYFVCCCCCCLFVCLFVKRPGGYSDPTIMTNF